MIRPDRHGLLGKAAIAGRCTEEKHFLLREPHAIPDDIRKQRAQPGAAREHEAIRSERRSIRQCYRRELAAVGLRWPDRDLAVITACGAKAVEDRHAGAARREIAAVAFENRPADALAIDLRIATRGLRSGQLLEVHLRIAQNREGGLFVLVVAFDEPENADAMIKLAPPAGFVLLPEHQGTRRHPRVDRAWSIGRANHPGLAARARARVAGSPRVEQRDARPAPPQIERRPPTERARADDYHVRFHEFARAARTARRTRSRSTGVNGGPHGSSQASSGITPSAASAHSMRRM